MELAPTSPPVLNCVGCIETDELGALESATSRFELAAELAASGGQLDPAGGPEADRPLAFPADHGAHPDTRTEWWYLTGNLFTADGRRFGYQFTLFRVGLHPDEAAGDSDWRSNQLYMGHLAVSDIAGARHHSAERFARAAAGLAGAQTGPFAVWLGPWRLHSERDFFPLSLEAQHEEFGLDLRLDAGKPMVLQGERGLSRKSATPGNASYYYSITRLATAGELHDRLALMGARLASEVLNDLRDGHPILLQYSAYRLPLAGWQVPSVPVSDFDPLSPDRTAHRDRCSRFVS